MRNLLYLCLQIFSTCFRKIGRTKASFSTNSLIFKIGNYLQDGGRYFFKYYLRNFNPLRYLIKITGKVKENYSNTTSTVRIYYSTTITSKLKCPARTWNVDVSFRNILDQTYVCKSTEEQGQSNFSLTE